MQANNNSLKNIFSTINEIQQLNTSMSGYELHQHICGHKPSNRDEFINVLIGALPDLAQTNPSFAGLATRTLVKYAADYHDAIIPVALEITPSMADNNVDYARIMYRSLLSYTPEKYTAQIQAEAQKYAHHFPHNIDFLETINSPSPQ